MLLVLRDAVHCGVYRRSIELRAALYGDFLFLRFGVSRHPELLTARVRGITLGNPLQR